VIGFVPAVEPEASAVTGSGVGPEPGDTVSAAMGGVQTVTPALAAALAPEVSVTVTATVKLPAPVYVWLAVAPDWGPTTALPSPKLNV